MAGTNNNVVKYFLEGDSSGLQKALNEVLKKNKKLMNQVDMLGDKYKNNLFKYRGKDYKKSAVKVDESNIYAKARAYLKSQNAFGINEPGHLIEGKRTNLKNSIAYLEKEYRSASEKLTGIQGGTLTNKQADLHATISNQLLQLKSFNKIKAFGEKQASVAQKTLNETFNTLKKFHSEVYSAEKAFNKQKLALAKEAADKQQEIDDALSVSGQFKAKTQADYMLKQTEVLKHMMPADAIGEIKQASIEYLKIVKLSKEGKVSQDDLANATLAVNDAFNKYNVSLRTMKNTMQLGGKGIRSFTDLMKQAEQTMMAAITSIGFWIQMLQKAISLISEGVKMYADYVESLNFLENATEDSANAMLRFTNAQVRAFGLDPKEVNETAAMFYSFAKSMGFASDQSELVSQNLTKLAQDLSSLHNVDLETATTKLRAALAGQSRALAVWGINVNDANVNEWLLNKGLNQTMTSMNEVSQAAARYAFVLEKSSVAQGDLAKTLQSPANQLRILRVQLKLFVQNFGSIFTTVIVPVVRLLNNLLQPINAFFQGLTSLSAQGFSSSVGNMSESMEDLGNTAEDTQKKMAGLTSLDEINQAGSNKTKKAGGLDAEIEKLLKGYNNFADTSNRLASVFESMGKAMAPIWDMFNNTGGISIISSLFEGFGLILQPIAKIFEWIGQFLAQIPEPLKNIIAMVTELVSGIAAMAIALTLLKTLTASKVFVQFVVILKSMMVAILGVVKALWSKVFAVKTVTLTEQIQGKQAKKTLVATLLQTAKNWLETASWKAKALAMLGVAGLAAGAVVGGVKLYKHWKDKKENKQNELNDNLYSINTPDISAPSFTSAGEAYSGNIMPQANYAAAGGDTTIELNMDGDTLARALWPKLENTKYQAGVNIHDF